jgi:hypothetical protein
MTTKTVKQSTELATSHSSAQELFRPKGTGYLEHALVAEALKMKLPKPPPLRFTKEVLTSAEVRAEQLVYLPRENAKGEPITASLICANLGNRAPLGGLILFGLAQKECWYRDNAEPFFFEETIRVKTTGDPGAYRLNAVSAIPDTKGVPYLQQTMTGARYVETEVYRGDLPTSLKQIVSEPTARQAEISELVSSDWQKGAQTQAELPFNQLFRGNFVEYLIWVLVNQYVNKTRLLEKEYAWTVSRSRCGDLVNFGDAGEDGAGLSDWGPQYAGDVRLGFFLSRSDSAGRES